MNENTGAAPAAPVLFAEPLPCPNFQQALLALYLLADFRRIEKERGWGPDPSWFKTQGVLVGITTPSRKTALRLARITRCLACDADVGANSTGDHIVALDCGGPEGLENFIPLCGRCNSSKGTRDLLDWWTSRTACALPPDVIVSYCRMMWRDSLRRRKQNGEAPEALASTVEAFAGELPGDEHRFMLRQRVSWLTGKRW